jgi:plastocyanin
VQLTFENSRRIAALIPGEFGAVDQKTRDAIDLAANRAGGYIGCVESPLTAEVSITADKFSPDIVVVKTDGTVTWKNTTTQIVIVTFQDQIKDGQSPPVMAIDVGQSASQTFPNPGTYRYSRGTITGRVIVSFF